MTDALLAVVGTLLIATVFLDALATTLAVSEGGGPVTRRATRLVWWLLLRMHRRDSDSGLLAAAGASLLIGTVLFWAAGLWGGWALILLAGDDAIVESTTRAPAGALDVVYYAGFTVFTLGVGDFVATTPVLRLLTAAASFTGLFLVTLAITYLISVVSAVVARRALAVQIASLGSSPGRIVAGGWAGDGFASAFVQHLVALTGAVTTSAEQHLAYPVLHYFHSHSRHTAAPVAVASLYDAMLILEVGVRAGARPPTAATQPLRQAIHRYVQTVEVTAMTSADAGVPRPPDLRDAVDADVPLQPVEQFERHLEAYAGRRKQLARIVSSDGWSW